MRKAIRVPLKDNGGGTLVWTIRRYPATANVAKVAFWAYTDHGGYERYGGTTWQELVAAFHATAENHGLDTKLS